MNRQSKIFFAGIVVVAVSATVYYAASNGLGQSATNTPPATRPGAIAETGTSVRPITQDRPGAYDTAAQSRWRQQAIADAVARDDDNNAPAPSLQGSQVDADFSFDTDGRLQADLGLKRYFDYFLSTIGELGLEEIRASLLQDLDQRLSPDQAHVARLLFERYLDYLTAVEELSPVPNPADRFQQLAELRRATLGEDLADAFFGEEERYTRTVLAEQAVLNDTTLNLEQQRQALDELHRDLPEELRRSREQTVAHHLALEQQQQFEALSIPPQQRYAERSALYGDEAATRLATLDQQQQAWQQRVQSYRQQRSRILAQNDAAGGNRSAQEQLLELRQSLFDSNELRRIESLEALDFPGYDDTPDN